MKGIKVVEMTEHSSEVQYILEPHKSSVLTFPDRVPEQYFDSERCRSSSVPQIQ